LGGSNESLFLIGALLAAQARPPCRCVETREAERTAAREG